MKKPMVRKLILTKFTSRLAVLVFSGVVFTAAPFDTALAQAPLNMGWADSFTILAGTTLTCTDSIVTGDVGVWPGTTITQSNCTVEGSVSVEDGGAKGAFLDFLSAYDEIGNILCDQTIDGNLAGQVLTPGVYCVSGLSATTGGVLTLDGFSTDTWIFKIGAPGSTANLEASNFTVELSSGETCADNVYWWVASYATMTDSLLTGNILAGSTITVSNSTFPGGLDGRALALTSVTLTDATVTGCEQAKPPAWSRCNQGVGNGVEDCDPGNSNQGDASRSNDEGDGTPGNPGRKGGNGK